MDNTLQNAIDAGIVEGLSFTGQTLEKINFKGAHLIAVNFEECVMNNCNFDNCVIERCAFRKAEMNNCRFRKAQLSWTDLRYVEINKATFEQATLTFCDLYRAMIGGVVIMRNCLIDNCSIYYTYFGESVLINRDNFKDHRLLQQNKEDYRRFLSEWNTYGCGVRKNDTAALSQWDDEESLAARFRDAEEIYKTLYGYWQSIGFLSDANWAYVQVKRMERRRMCNEIGKMPFSKQIGTAIKIFNNALLDTCFGFGESLGRMIGTYCILVLLFAFVFSAQVSLGSWVEAFKISLMNMVGVGSEELNGISPFVDLLNVMQTTLGILLTGIFGFILGNKIRNQ